MITTNSNWCNRWNGPYTARNNYLSFREYFEMYSSFDVWSIVASNGEIPKRQPKH